MMRIAILSLLALLSGCAGYTSISVTCAPQLGQATVSGSAAASCGTITVSGNTPTATATTTVPVQAPIGPGAGLGLGGQGLTVPMTGAIVMPPTALPQGISRAPPIRRRVAAPRVSMLPDIKARLDELFARPALRTVALE